MEAREDIDSLLLYYKQTEQKLHLLLDRLEYQKENTVGFKTVPKLFNNRYYVAISYEMTKYSSNIGDIQNMLRLSVINNDRTFSLGDKEYSCLFEFVWLFNIWTRGGLFWWAVNDEDAWSIGKDQKDMSEIELRDIDTEYDTRRFSHSEIANHVKKSIISDFFNSELRNIYKANAAIIRESILIRERYGMAPDSDITNSQSIIERSMMDTIKQSLPDNFHQWIYKQSQIKSNSYPMIASGLKEKYQIKLSVKRCADIAKEYAKKHGLPAPPERRKTKKNEE